jgi:hypothetical protein
VVIEMRTKEEARTEEHVIHIRVYRCNLSAI